MTARTRAASFAEVYKDMVAADGHVPTALGNEKGKKRQRAGKSWGLPFEVKKSDADQQLIFGWASVVEKDGRAVIDKQGDIIPIPELESAAYDFVLNYGDHGFMHVEKDNRRLVESMVFTKEKQALLKIDLGMVAWWAGFKVADPAVWALHKAGKLPEFSIGGFANPQEV